MSQALYRKYRSRSLAEVVGQPHITEILSNALARGNIAHAYLLTGPKGVGKTSVARILAHEINHLPYSDESTNLDIIEIDAASNNSVEDVRNLRDKVLLAPVSADKKVYIIDEVHMLSKAAFNALLKTLEEPPSHVVFILATTDVDKLPATILSRVQRFNFHAISQADIASHLATIAAAESIDITAEALDLISQHSSGGFRDAISLLDQVQNISDHQISASDVARLLGIGPTEAIESLITSYRSGDLGAIVSTINQLEQEGTTANVVAGQLIQTINERLADNPDLLPLLADLLKVTGNNWPKVQLLVALAKNADQTGFNSTSKVSEPPKTPEKPTKITPSATKPAKKPIEKPKQDEKPTPKPVKKPDINDLPSEEPIDNTSNVPPESTENMHFSWPNFLTAAKAKLPSAHTLLAKCGYDVKNTTLIIYAGRKFEKTQLDKLLPKITGVAQTIAENLDEINILAAAKPSGNSQTDAIIDIMGGGEEIEL